MLKLFRSTLFAVLLAMLCLVGCNQQSSGDPLAIAYPPNWPIPELVVPPGATGFDSFQGKFGFQQSSAEMMMDGVRDERRKSTTYGVAFETDLEWDELKAHVEACLEPLGYKFYNTFEPTSNTCFWAFADGNPVAKLSPPDPHFIVMLSAVDEEGKYAMGIEVKDK